MGWLFGNKSLADLSVLRPDIHSHLIPGIDDGAGNMEESVSLIRQMYELGYRKLIITPHVRAGSFENDTSTFDSRLEEVQEVLSDLNIPIKLEVGAEQTMDEDFMYHFHNGELKDFGRNKYVLIEFPFTNMPLNLKDTIFELQSAGYSLILAHPERYIYMKEEPEMIKYLHDSGILLQINIVSLIGFYGKLPQQFAKWLIKKDYVDLVGSDLHHQRHIDAIKKALSNKDFVSLVESGRLMNSMF